MLPTLLVTLEATRLTVHCCCCGYFHRKTLEKAFCSCTAAPSLLQPTGQRRCLDRTEVAAHSRKGGGGEKRKGGEGGEQEEEGNEKRWMEGREREREKEAEICKCNFRRTNSVHWGHLKKNGRKKTRNSARLKDKNEEKSKKKQGEDIMRD